MYHQRVAACESGDDNPHGHGARSSGLRTRAGAQDNGHSHANLKHKRDIVTQGAQCVVFVVRALTPMPNVLADP